MIEVTLRSLPEESGHAGTIHARQSNWVEIELRDGAPSLSRQTPVEITAPTMLMLGILLASHGNRVSVAIEHQVDLSRAARIFGYLAGAEAPLR